MIIPLTYETAVISRKLNPNSTFGVDWWELSELTVGSKKKDRLVGYSWADVRKGSRVLNRDSPCGSPRLPANVAQLATSGEREPKLVR